MTGENPSAEREPEQGEQPKRKRALPAASKRRVPESQPEREIFARHLRQFRIDAELSQRELAQRTGIAQAHISEMENAMHNVCIDTMVKLAQAVRKPLYEFFMP
jgi:DNA-binding XRE family transcriptional regulator